MSKTMALLALNTALRMEEGEFLPIKFSSRGARESFRVQFHREKQSQEKFNPDTRKLICEAKMHDGEYWLFIRKGSKEVYEMSKIVVVNSKTGEVREVDVQVPAAIPHPRDIKTGLIQQDTAIRPLTKELIEMERYMKRVHCKQLNNKQESNTCQDFSGMTDEELQAYIASPDPPSIGKEAEDERYSAEDIAELNEDAEKEKQRIRDGMNDLKEEGETGK